MHDGATQWLVGAGAAAATAALAQFGVNLQADQPPARPAHERVVSRVAMVWAVAPQRAPCRQAPCPQRTRRAPV